MPVIDGKLDARPSPIAFWEFETGRLMSTKPKPYIDPALQEGTTPLVKRSGGKATRDFLNFHYPAINAADHIGPRAIIEGDHKLVIREKKSETSIELFNLKADPAEKTNLIDQQPELARKLQTDLRNWQVAFSDSCTGDWRQQWFLDGEVGTVTNSLEGMNLARRKGGFQSHRR